MHVLICVIWVLILLLLDPHDGVDFDFFFLFYYVGSVNYMQYSNFYSSNATEILNVCNLLCGLLNLDRNLAEIFSLQWFWLCVITKL